MICELFHSSPFALDHHDVVEPDRLRQRNLQSGDQVAQHRPCGNTRHQPGHARRRQQTRADLTHGGKRHQRAAEADNHDHHHHRTRQHARLRVNPARLQVVLAV